MLRHLLLVQLQSSCKGLSMPSMDLSPLPRPVRRPGKRGLPTSRGPYIEVQHEAVEWAAVPRAAVPKLSAVNQHAARRKPIGYEARRRVARQVLVGARIVAIEQIVETFRREASGLHGDQSLS